MKCYCEKSQPSFNFTRLKATYYIQCKEIGMIDVKNKKCNCGKAHQSFNFIGLKAEYCSQCKKKMDD